MLDPFLSFRLILSHRLDRGQPHGLPSLFNQKCRGQLQAALDDETRRSSCLGLCTFVVAFRLKGWRQPRKFRVQARAVKRSDYLATDRTMHFMAADFLIRLALERPLLKVDGTGDRVLETAAFDPNVWFGRALQEVLVDLVVSGLASMYQVSSWSCFAPDHHGYQRACVLISGQASSGPFRGHQCSHAPGRPILYLFLFLSQTSAGNC